MPSMSDDGCQCSTHHSALSIVTEIDAAMNNQDPIADMLTRIRNANRVGRRLVQVPKSKICTGIAQVLKDEGYIDEYDVTDDAR